MSRFAEPLPVEVNVGPCDCPGSPHPDGDVVYLAPALSMSGGMAAQGAILAASDPETGNIDQVRFQEELAKVWIRHGVRDWTFVDEDGDKVPLTPDNIARALPYGKGGRPVAERADDLYREDILAPLVDRLKKLSQGGRSGRSTSPPRPRTKRPSRSSTATTEGAHPNG